MHLVIVQSHTTLQYSQSGHKFALFTSHRQTLKNVWRWLVKSGNFSHDWFVVLHVTVCLFVFGATAPSGPVPPYSRGFYITHSDALQSVGLLWTSDQLVAETSIWHTHHSQQRNVYAFGWIRNHNLSRRAVADRRLRPRGHWDRHTERSTEKNIWGLRRGSNMIMEKTVSR
jgi:hypothetical protein